MCFGTIRPGQIRSLPEEIVMSSAARRILFAFLGVWVLTTLLGACATHRPTAVSSEPKGVPVTCPTLSEAIATITVAPRCQLGLKADGSDTPVLEHWGKRIGIPLESVAAFSVILLDDTHRILVVRSKKPVDHKAVSAAIAGLAVGYPEPKLTIVADSAETLKIAVKGLPWLKTQLDQANKHDLTIAARTMEVKSGEVHVSSYKFSAPPLKLTKSPRSTLFDVPAPEGMRSMTCTVDVAKEMVLRVEVQCADAASARETARLMGAARDTIRGSMLFGGGYLEMIKAFSVCDDQETQKILDMLPVDLIAPLESAFGKAVIKVAGTTVSFAADLPLSGARSGAELTKFHEKLVPEWRSPDTPGLFFNEVAEKEEKEAHSPTPATSAPSADLFPAATPPARTSSTCTTGSPLPSTFVPTGVVSSGSSVAPICSTGAALTTTPVGTPASALVVTPPTSTPPVFTPVAKPTTLTVGNCSREAVLVYTVEDSGELTFRKRIESGDDEELPAALGSRWMVISLHESHQAIRHKVEREKDLLLIRREKMTSAGQPTWSGNTVPGTR
jgi:hypothetical protein